MRRRLRLLAAMVTLLAAAIAGDALVGAAAGVEVTKAGWWNKTQQFPGVTVPAVPQGPPGSLTVSNDPSGPAAIAAVRYLVPELATTRLTLRSASGPISLPPGTSITACPTTKVWDPASNGAWAARPTYDCVALSSGGIPVGSGSEMTWDLGAAFQVSPAAIDIALVPTGNPLPFSVTFEAPNDTSLVVVQPSPSDGADQTIVSNGSTEVIDPGSEPSPLPPLAFGAGEAIVVSPDIPAPAGARTGNTGRQVAAPPTSFRRASRPLPVPDDRAERIVSVILLLAMVGGLLFVGGRQARPPRLLGSLGQAQAPVAVAAVGQRMGGVGRFARLRRGPPTRL